jgi:iron-sulfur cluster assembly accessory protein
MDVSTAIDPVINLSQEAAQEIKSLLQKPENEGKAFRVYVEQGGCSGMQYSMTFDEKRPDDFSGEMHGVLVLVAVFVPLQLAGNGDGQPGQR